MRINFYPICIVLIFGALFTMFVATSSKEDSTDGQSQIPNEKDFWTRVALRALRQLLNYTMQKSNQLNLDGVVGLTIMNGQFSVLLKRDKRMPADLKEELQSLVQFGTMILDRAKPFLASYDPTYFKKFEPIFSNDIFGHDYESRMTNASLLYPALEARKQFDLMISDNCISQCLGTGEYEGRKCAVSDDCWKIMTAPNYENYSITHQILYLLLGESMNCAEQFVNAEVKLCTKSLKVRRCRNVHQLQEIMCANVYDEMKLLDEHGFPDNSEDLFMEQMMLCGILGFKEVCTVRWLQIILAWQKPNGCYVNTFNRPLQANDHRQKRMDITIDDGCSSHKTSMGAGALAICARFFVEDWDFIISGQRFKTPEMISQIPTHSGFSEFSMKISIFTLFIFGFVGFAWILRLLLKENKGKLFVQ